MKNQFILSVVIAIMYVSSACTSTDISNQEYMTNPSSNQSLPPNSSPAPTSPTPTQPSPNSSTQAPPNPSTPMNPPPNSNPNDGNNGNNGNQPTESVQTNLTEDQVEWTGQAIQDFTLMVIKNIQGPVSIYSSEDTSNIRVSIRKTSISSSIESVYVQLIEEDESFLFCTMYPDIPGEDPNFCNWDESSMLTGDNDVQVSYEVYIPTEMFSWAETVSGDILIRGVKQLAVGSSVSGSVTIDTLEVAVAESVSGDLDLKWDPSTMEYYDFDSVAFKTTSGHVQLTIPASSSIDFYANTLSGNISTDFNLTGEGERSVEEQINGGGYSVSVETVSGDIELRSY